MHPKRIVHLSTVHSPHDPRIYHKQCRTLAKAGFDVTLIIPDDGSDFTPQDGVKVILLPRPANRRERLTKTRKLAYREAKALKAEIYHFHDPELITVGRKLKTENNVVIYDIHEDYETAMQQKEYLPGFLAPLAALAYRTATNLLTKNFELCLAEKYYREKFPRGQCILNYPLLTPREISPSGGGERNRLLYTGNVTPERGAYIHARLPELDQKIAVEFIGKCSRPIADEVFRIAAANSDRLKITGIDRYIPREQIEDAYFNHRWLAGLALFPPTEHYKKKELTKFFEYMYAEIPILCSDFPVWKEFVTRHDCGIAVDPNDDEAIARALQFLKENPQRAQEMGKNGRQAVLRELNWEAEGARLVQWYIRLLQ
jgi:glycosyltransferase involved in cell wall biosynthesis